MGVQQTHGRILHYRCTELWSWWRHRPLHLHWMLGGRRLFGLAVVLFRHPGVQIILLIWRRCPRLFQWTRRTAARRYRAVSQGTVFCDGKSLINIHTLAEKSVATLTNLMILLLNQTGNNGEHLQTGSGRMSRLGQWWLARSLPRFTRSQRGRCVDRVANFRQIRGAMRILWNFNDCAWEEGEQIGWMVGQCASIERGET